MVFQNNTTECAHYTGFYALDFNIDTFVDEVKLRVGNPDLRVGLMAPHTRASDYAGDTIDGDLYTPDMLDGAIQATIKAVAADMKHCDFIVNSGLAIRYARADENLDALGHDMTRIDLTNTEPPVNNFDKVHLEYGVPMFIAAMSYAMAVCGDEVGCISWTPDAPAFDARKIYGKNDVLEYNGTLYRKNVSTAAEAWDDSHWDEHDNAYLAYLGKLCAIRAVFPDGGETDPAVVKSSGLYLQSSNTYGYTNANDFPANRIFELSSNITSAKIANLPAYNELAYVLTLAYDTSTSYSMQIYMGVSTFATRIKAINGWRPWVKYAQRGPENA